MPPVGKGIWGAAWMQPADQEKYGKWPASGEIDFAGSINDKKLLAQAIHYGSAWPDNEQSTVITKRPDGQPWSAGFSTYGLDWEANRITGEHALLGWRGSEAGWLWLAGCKGA